jgi:hypothetical protein
MSVVTVAALLIGAAQGRAERSGDGGESPWRLCIDAIADQERSQRIPRQLLAAIALTESGRWDADRKVKAPWPWTVNAEGEGRFYGTKAEAVHAVDQLRARDVRNIDVGCMQINLLHHPDAFADFDQALEPVSNVGYGARHLKALFDETHSWQEAAGRYHSATPERARDYRLKVVTLWNEQRRAVRTEHRRTVPRRAVVPIDRERTEALNAWGRRMAANDRAIAAATAPPARLAGYRWSRDAALAGGLGRTLPRGLEAYRSSGNAAARRPDFAGAPLAVRIAPTRSGRYSRK